MRVSARSRSASSRRAPPLGKIIGPGIILVGVGLASGEFILFPYIASQVGLVFVWAALVGLLTQFFINMEIERYTLATGETALTGFSRLWRHWAWCSRSLAYFAEHLAGVGDERRDADDLPVRRRRRRGSRSACCLPSALILTALAGRLRGARAARRC